jgi:hypothetical protein
LNGRFEQQLKLGLVVAAEERERKTRRKGNLSEFFAASPSRGSGAEDQTLGLSPAQD